VNEYVASIEAQEEQERQNHRVVLDQYADISAIEELDARSDDAKAVQEALNALGFDVGRVDGLVGPRTQAGYAEYVADRAERQEMAEEQAELEQAEQVLTQAQALLRNAEAYDATQDIEALENMISNIEQRIGQLMQEKQNLQNIPHTSVDDRIQEIDEIIASLLDRKEELEAALEDTQNAIPNLEEQVENAQ
jgi:peptidoglycan hydrolase-like protein with peptidoglycan-binding domain